MYLLASIPLTVVVVALEQASYTVTEGNTVAACVEIISSASSLECDIVATLTTVNGTAGEHPFCCVLLPSQRLSIWLLSDSSTLLQYTSPLFYNILAVQIWDVFLFDKHDACPILNYYIHIPFTIVSFQ